MPLHKSGRAQRLDPTMISAPLGDFRHTMHIGRGGDAFGDTSFLSSHGPSNTESFKSVQSPVAVTSEPTETRQNWDDDRRAPDETLPELRHSESVSSFDLDLDLGPSIMGDVLGVMDGLGLGCEWAGGTVGDEEVFSPADGRASPVGFANETRTESLGRGEEHLNEVNGVRSKGFRPKVRFSDKKEEIVGRQYIAHGLEVEHEKICMGPAEGVHVSSEEFAKKEAVRPESANHQAGNSPSPSSSESSEYEGVSPLDRRREEDHLAESGSEEEHVAGDQGYTFEDESDEEIGL
ncbi:cdc42 effector protein 5 [Electrophorus electricus]|uniref:CRIB domain-containing protein n=1 Tax=Electrophorus electricus TaxID=8005 RepID=A0A4W4FR65_ELEEL|nr:cdc42 effector protein 5 [Electrophorus electricus]